jgi:membrane-associated phospholipid phosphatase
MRHFSGGLLQLDHSALRWVVERRLSALNGPMKAWTRAGNWQAWMGILVLGVLWGSLFGGEVRELCLRAAPRVIGTWIFCTWLKRVIRRKRPDQILNGLRPLLPNPDPYSFPSSHSACAWAACLSLGLSIQAPWALPLLIVHAVGVSFSRIYVGAHFPSDVLAGSGIGVITALTARGF